jgi:FGFR1 oncogene partner
MSEDNNSIEIQQEAKEIIMKELEKKGVINYMRAKIKKSILDIINSQKESFKQKLDFDYMTPLHRLNKPKEIVLVCQLIKEFLKFYELEYTLPIFENESNIKENIKRETLLKELKLEDKKDSSKPVLLLLLQDKLNRKDDNINYQKNIDRYENCNKSEGELSNVEINKNQLSPSSFGSTNKSLDMNINKYNTFNINEVYKKENNSFGEKIINDKENNKFVKIDKDKYINENIKENKNNELNKEENKEEINEEINGKEIKEKEENKNIESQSSQAYESTASNK